MDLVTASAEEKNRRKRKGKGYISFLS